MTLITLAVKVVCPNKAKVNLEHVKNVTLLQLMLN